MGAAAVTDQNHRFDARASDKNGADAWHALPHAEVLTALETSVSGISSDEALRRLDVYGANALPEATTRHPIFRFLAQFNNALIYFLLAAAVAALALGHTIDAVVIVAVVTVNAIVGFIQEGKAERALSAIRDMIAPHAAVMRDGVRTTIPVKELVPGDLVLVEAGDRVPADLRLVRARNLLIDEAMLTGESVTASKAEAPVAVDAALGDRASMAFSGTLVAAGQGAGIAVATGRLTQIGHISALIAKVEPLTTPLLRQINAFGRGFTVIAFLASAALFAFAVLVRGYDWVEALIAVVALAVGAIPEGLPAVITITLAIGVRRMAARNAVIRRLPAVETLGATSIICSDKTGTLTRNEMTARRLITATHRLEASGSGYAPEGRFTALGSDDDVAALEAAEELIRCGLLCNDATLAAAGGRWTVNGDPMEGALVTLAVKAGLDPDHLRAEWPRQDEIPFDALHRFMASRHGRPQGGAVLFVKGAPEALLARCGTQAEPGSVARLDSAYWADEVAGAAREGERVLGFAMKMLPEAASDGRLDFDDVADLCFLGLVGFIDPPRPEVIAAIAECRSAGIAVKMITGDHAATAAAIAAQLGLADHLEVATGADVDAASDAELVALATRASVFARTSPEHKLRIVRALRSTGAVVAMTGDGVNDAPALKQADVGVAMGVKGTEAAKEASEMVLLDDNFVSIVSAVHEGRTVYDNVRKVIAWTLPTNGGEVLAVVAAILFGFVMPMSAVQILWINLITTITLGLALAFEPPEPGVMGRPPRRSDAPLLTLFLLWRVLFVSVLPAVGTLGMFFYALGEGRDLATARTLVVNTIVVLEIFYLFNVRFMHMTSFSWHGALGTPAVLLALVAVLAAQFAFTYVPAMHELFGTTPVTLADGMRIVGLGVVFMAVLEGEKMLLRRFGVVD
jgi:magnesium-transporting ATPase (P-type)